MNYTEAEYYRRMPRWKQALLRNPEAFILRYFPHRIDALKDFHRKLIHAYFNRNRSLMLFPAAHGKTTLCSTLLPILDICRDPNIRVAIIAKNDTESESIMGAIQVELVDNDLLVEDFGPFKPEGIGRPWGLGRIQVAKRTRRGKESTITAFGAGAKTVLGYRTDITICDDVVTGENSATPTQREKIRNWFDLSVETGPEHADSRLVVVGTRFDPQDLYGDLIETFDPDAEEKIWKVEQFDAIVDVDKRETLWPERWSWERLMQQKVKVGTLSFNKRYRNIAVDASRIVIREAFIRGGWESGVEYPGCLDKNHSVGDYEPSWRIVTGFDPASGAGRAAKFCAHVTLAQGSCRAHDHCYWVIDLNRDQMTLPQQVDLILSKHVQYSAQASIIEANSYQVGLFQAVEHRMDELGKAFNVLPHYTNRSNKPDPELGVAATSRYFEQGKVHIPWKDPYSQRIMRDFVDELIMYPSGRTTDTVMAYWFAWMYLEQSHSTFQSFNRLHHGPRRPWAKQVGRVLKNPAYAQREVA